MVKATLAKGENPDWLAIGQALDRCRTACQLTDKEFAAAMNKDVKQVARWFAGKERPQVDAVFAVARFRRALIVALSERAGEGVEVETVVTIRRTA